MTSLTLLDQNLLLDENSSPEVGTPSPPNSQTFQLCPPSAEGTEPPVQAIIKTPSVGRCNVAERERTRLGFPDCVYSHAAHVFQVAHVEKPLAHRVIKYAPTTHTHTEDAPGILYEDEPSAEFTELWAYKLAFSALKFQELMEDMLIDSCFYASQQMPDDLMSLVVVMLYDLQDRNFQPREPMTGEREGLIEEVRRVESSLFSFRTKLAASLARCRIKQNLTSIVDILPKSVREKHQRKLKLLLCVWVNTLKTSVEEVCETLNAAGFVQVDPKAHLEGSVFYKDVHCPDVLLFPHQAQDKLDKTLLLRDHTLIKQAKYYSMTASVVRPLFVKDADILMVGSFSAQTVAHVAVHASACGVRVHVCGLSADPVQREGIQSTLSAIGCKNVQFLSDEFAVLNEWDSRIQKVRVILLLPSCSISGLSDPIAYIINENGDRELLQDLSQGTISHTKLDSLVGKQMQDLSHALSFPKVHAVVYCTCSVYIEENELLVKRALEIASVRPKLRPFRIASTGWKEEGEDKFFLLEETGSTDGCFICVLKRDEPAETETVQDILARAAAKGLLEGVIAPQTSDQVKQKKRQKRKGAAAPLPPLFPLQPAISDTTRLPNDLSVPDGVYEQLPLYTTVHIRAGSVSVSTLKQTLIDEDSNDSCHSYSFNEVTTTLNQATVTLDQALTALNQASAEPGSDSNGKNEAFDATSKQLRGHRCKPKALRRTRRTKSKSHTQTSKEHGSQPSRKRLLRRRQTHRQTHARTHTLTPPTANIHPATPTSPPGTIATVLKSQKLYSRRPQHETSQEVLVPQAPALDLNGVIKQDAELYRKGSFRSMQVVLPPIRAVGRTVLSSDLSSHLLQSSTNSSSTGSYLSSGLSLPNSRSESRDSGVRPWH